MHLFGGLTLSLIFCELFAGKVIFCPIKIASPELPPVCGQRRHRRLATARSARAVELQNAGLTHVQIAVELGYVNKGKAFHLVSEA